METWTSACADGSPRSQSVLAWRVLLSPPSTLADIFRRTCLRSHLIPTFQKTIFFVIGILIYLLLRSLCKMSELYICCRKVRTSERGVTEWPLHLCLSTRAVHALLSNQNEWKDTAGQHRAGHTQSYNFAHYNFVLFCKWWITWRPSILIYIEDV
jgi:hypothetical protein